ncbi:hypothetical protein ACM66T_05825 [Sulfurimonas sp. ST-25]|uniref:hypothetical protein n=1 Tax=Sulfurimonas sp. ST-25 TaxID=3400151 RepID=UPI003A8C0ABD
MDINLLGVGAIIGATIVAGTNAYIFIQNRNKDEIKERIEKLYGPLYVYYLENMKYGSSKNELELYEHYLALKKIYISNSIFASDILKELFDSLMSVESDLMEMSLEERVHKMMTEPLFNNDKYQDVCLYEMMYRLEGWIDREHDELQLYYAKSFIGRFLWRLESDHNSSYARGTIPAGRSFDN